MEYSICYSIKIIFMLLPTVNVERLATNFQTAE